MSAGAKRETRGTHRARPLGETYRLMQPFARQAGVTRVADVTGLDVLGIPTTMVTRPNARSLSVSQGKGLTLEAAKVSGIMEALEQHHGENVHVPLRLARISALHAEGTCVELSRLPRFPRVSGALTGETRLLWALAESLSGPGPRWVPYELVHLDLTLPLPEGSGHFPLSSNGLASGNTLPEATLHGLCEVIERDARTLFFLEPAERAAQRRVDPASVADPDAAQLLRRFEQQGIAVALWDITSDVGVACVLAGALEREDNPFRRVPAAFGSGCHPDRNVALLRALTEVAQTRLTNIVGTRDDTSAAALQAARSDAAQERARALLQSRDCGRQLAQLPHQLSDSFEEDLRWMLGRLEHAGLPEALRVDLSHAGAPYAVVRVIVPGLEFLLEMPGYVPSERGLRALGEVP